MRFTAFVVFFPSLASAFCEDGIAVPDLVTGDVVVTWVQSPLFSTNPEINQTGKYLNLFHTALVFRQGAKNWTLEFDATSVDMSIPIIPRVSEAGVLTWEADARWCLREGIYHGRSHWTTNFVDVATISPEQTLRIFYDFIPNFNSTIPGAFPQYQFWRVEHALSGDLLLDDTTCNHVFGVLQFLRDVHQVSLKDMDYQATRVTLPALGWSEVNMSNSDENAEVVGFYSTLSRAVGTKTGVDAMKAIFEFFLPWKFIYEPTTGKYFKINLGAPGEVVLIFFVNFDTIGDLPPPPGTTCNVSSACADTMATFATYGMGEECKRDLGIKSSELTTGGCHADATARAEDVNCFCGSQCYVESDACLEKMNQHCKRGGGSSCESCLILSFPVIALFGPCDSSWGANAIISTSAARSCYCDDSQWKPTARMLLA